MEMWALLILTASLIGNLGLLAAYLERGRIITEQQELIDEYRKATEAVGKVARL